MTFYPDIPKYISACMVKNVLSQDPRFLLQSWAIKLMVATNCNNGLGESYNNSSYSDKRMHPCSVVKHKAIQWSFPILQSMQTLIWFQISCLFWHDPFSDLIFRISRHIIFHPYDLNIIRMTVILIMINMKTLVILWVSDSELLLVLY